MNLFKGMQKSFVAFLALSLFALPIISMDKSVEPTELSMRLPGAPPP